MNKKKIMKRFAVITAVFAMALSNIGIFSSVAHAQSIQTVTTLPPDLVAEQFAVVGGQVTYQPEVNTAAVPTQASIISQGLLNLQNTQESNGDKIVRGMTSSGTSVVGWIEYGTSATPDQFSSFVILPFNQPETKEFHLVLSGLQPNTIYNYRAAALSVFGVSRGASMSFTTSGVGNGNYTLTASPTTLNPGNNITVHFETPNAVNSQLDWVGMYMVGDNDRQYTRYEYTAGRQSGDVTFRGNQPGRFEFRYFTNNGFSRAAVSNAVTVQHPGNGNGEYTVNASPTTVAPGSSVSVAFTTPGTRNARKDWIGLYAVNANDRTFLTYKYTNGVPSSTMTFTAPTTEGDYNFRYFVNNGYHRVAVSNNIHVSAGATNEQAPRATSTQALAITNTSAQLNGMVNPNGSNTSAWFTWGTNNANLDQQTPLQNVGSSSIPTTVFRTVIGLAANTTYYFRITAQNSFGLSQGEIMSFTTGTGSGGNAPIVVSMGATNITQTGATLNATVNPQSTTTNGWFEWGTVSDQLNQRTPTTTLGNGSADAPLAANISGLAANTAYYFRAVGMNGSGTTNGATLNFTTQPTTTDAPLVTTMDATNVTQTNATFNAMVNPRGTATNGWFEWGTASDQLTQKTPTTTLGNGTSDTPLNANVSGLTANTQYFFRAVGMSSAGTTNGATFNLTTLPTSTAGAPLVTTKIATDIGQTAMTLHADINPQGLETPGSFWWGTDANNLTQQTAELSMGTGTTNVEIVMPITGLQADTLYFFRATAHNSLGTTNGAVLSARTNSTGGTTNGGYGLTASPEIIQPGETVTVHFNTPTGTNSAVDWIGLYLVGENDHAYRTYQYTNGSQSADLTFRIDEGGMYEFRYFMNNGYTLKATSNAVSVSPQGGNNTYSVATSPSTVAPRQTITVDFNTPIGTNNSVKDWIAMYSTGADDHSYITWKYTGGVAQGAMSFTAPATDGTYEFRYFLNNGYTRVASSNSFTVSATAAATSAARASLVPGSNTASVAANTNESTTATVQNNTNVSTSETNTVAVTNDSSTPASSTTDSGNDVQLSVATTEIQPGGAIDVSFTATPSSTHNKDWVALYRVDSPDNKSYLSWKYTSGATDGAMHFTIKQAGTYEFRYYSNNSYVRVATSEPITVGAATTESTTSGPQE